MHDPKAKAGRRDRATGRQQQVQERRTTPPWFSPNEDTPLFGLNHHFEPDDLQNVGLEMLTDKKCGLAHFPFCATKSGLHAARIRARRPELYAAHQRNR